MSFHRATRRQTELPSMDTGFVLKFVIGMSVLLNFTSYTQAQTPFVDFISSSSEEIAWLGDQITVTCSLHIDSDPAKRGDKSLYWHRGVDITTKLCQIPLKDITDSKTTNATCPRGYTGHVTKAHQTTGEDLITLDFTMQFTADRENGGKYRCFVVGGSPDQFSKYNQATTMIPPTCNYSVAQSLEVHEGDDVTVYCTTHNTHTNPLSTLTWQLSGPDNKEVPSQHVSENSSTIIRKQKFKPSDNGLTFQCKETIPKTGSDKSCSVGPFNVLYAPTGQITRHNSSITEGIQHENFLTIYSCNFDANPKVMHTDWFSDGMLVKGDDFDDNFIIEGTGTFLYVMQDRFSTPNATYTILECRASNSVGNGSANITHIYTSVSMTTNSESVPVAAVAVGAFFGGAVVGILSFLLFLFVRTKYKRNNYSIPDDVEQSPQKDILLPSDTKKTRKNRYETTVAPKLKPDLAPKPKLDQDKSAELQLTAPKYQNAPPADKKRVLPHVPSQVVTAKQTSTSNQDTTFKANSPSMSRAGYTPMNLQENADNYYEAINAGQDEQLTKKANETVYANVDC